MENPPFGEFIGNIYIFYIFLGPLRQIQDDVLDTADMIR